MRRILQSRFIFVLVAAVILAVVCAILFFLQPTKLTIIESAAPQASPATNADPASKGARWTYVVTNRDGARFYIDLQTRRHIGESVEAWELADYKDNGTNWRSMATLVRYNCWHGTSAVQEISYFEGGMGTGRLVQTSEEHKQFEKPISGSPSEVLNKVACKPSY